MSLKSYFVGRYIVNTVIPAIVDYGFKFKWLAGHRTLVGALLAAIGLCLQTPQPPDVLAALHISAGTSAALLSLGGYLIIIGNRFKAATPIPAAPAKEVTQ
jgi:hypothetical protein